MNTTAADTAVSVSVSYVTDGVDNINSEWVRINRNMGEQWISSETVQCLALSLCVFVVRLCVVRFSFTWRGQGDGDAVYFLDAHAAGMDSPKSGNKYTRGGVVSRLAPNIVYYATVDVYNIVYMLLLALPARVIVAAALSI